MDDELSGTEIDTQVAPGVFGRGKKRACPYSPSPVVVEKMERDSAKKIVCIAYVTYLRTGRKAEIM
jgi:hypothetical protein